MTTNRDYSQATEEWRERSRRGNYVTNKKFSTHFEEKVEKWLRSGLVVERWDNAQMAGKNNELEESVFGVFGKREFIRLWIGWTRICPFGVCL